MTTATITITAQTWDEQRVTETDPAHAIASARFTTVWSGDAVGSSTCWMLISYVSGDPSDPQSLSGPYTGYEAVTATIDGRLGTFVLAVSGAHSDAVARTDVRIVEGSGTGDLAGISGSGHYSASAMQYELQLDYRL